MSITKQLREHLLLTQHDIAYRLKISLPRYIKLEEEDNPDFRRKVRDITLKERVQLLKLLK